MIRKIDPGTSEKDSVWNQILNEVDTIVANDLTSGKSREMHVAEFLKTPKGQKLYDQYSDANDIKTPVQKTAEPEPMTLREFAERKLEKIAKRCQTGDMTIESATVKAMDNSEEYREIYTLLHDSGPLENIDFSQNVSKSKSDAIMLFKAEIYRAARQAGV